MNISPLEIVLYIFFMICVGFFEEMIFCGFLFNAMLKNGIKSAFIVSSATFGIGHIVNLVDGSKLELLQNILHAVYVIVIGFAFVMSYYETKSLVTCILTYNIFNSLWVFANETVLTPQKQIISAILITIIASGYALYIISS